MPRTLAYVACRANASPTCGPVRSAAEQHRFLGREVVEEGSRRDVGRGGDGGPHERPQQQRPQLVHHIEGGDLVGLGEGRVVEDGVDQVLHGPTAAHHGLADVHQLGGGGAEDVDAQNLQVLGGHQQLQHAVRVTGDLAAGQFSPRGTAVRDADGESFVVSGRYSFGSGSAQKPTVAKTATGVYTLTWPTEFDDALVGD